MNRQVIANSTARFDWVAIGEMPSATDGQLLSPLPSQVLREPRFEFPLVANSSGPQVLVVPDLNLIAPAPSMEAAARNEDAVLAGLPPLARWQFMARHNKLEFAFSAIAALVAVVTIVLSTIHLIPSILSAVSWAAMAQETSAPGTASDGIIAPGILLIMGIIVLWCICTVSYSRTSANVTFARDTMKTIVGFIGGFLGGRASR